MTRSYSMAAESPEHVSNQPVSVIRSKLEVATEYEELQGLLTAAKILNMSTEETMISQKIAQLFSPMATLSGAFLASTDTSSHCASENDLAATRSVLTSNPCIKPLPEPVAGKKYHQELYFRGQMLLDQIGLAEQNEVACRNAEFSNFAARPQMVPAPVLSHPSNIRQLKAVSVVSADLAATFDFLDDDNAASGTTWLNSASKAKIEPDDEPVINV